MYRILAIDGGGSRGILPAAVLAKLESDLQKLRPGSLLRDWFDLVAGTSTGSIISAAIAAGLPMSRIADVYLKQAKDIFHDSFADNLKDVGNTFGAQYSSDVLREILEDDSFFGKQCLSDIGKHINFAGRELHVMIPSFDLSPIDDGIPVNFKPRVFNSFFRRDGKEKVSDVIIRSTAAPTFFPIAEMKYIDGGVALNNPSMAALSFALNRSVSDSVQYGGVDGRSKGLSCKPDELRLLSIGTGFDNTIRIPEDTIKKKGDWGTAQWIFHLSDLLVEPNKQATEYYVKNILNNEQYYRVEFNLPKLGIEGKVDLDCTSHSVLKQMQQVAQVQYEHDKNNIEFVMAF